MSNVDSKSSTEKTNENTSIVMEKTRPNQNTQSNPTTESSNTEGIWQDVNQKRKKRDSPEENRNIKKKTINDHWLATANRYQPLTVEEAEMENETVPKVLKAPPIFVHGVNNIKPLIELLNTLAKDNYETKLISGSQVKIQLKSTEKYNVVITELKKRNTEFHSFQCKEDKPFKVIIKNLHHTTDIDELTEEISHHGHEVTRITNMLNRQTKNPLPMFIVDLKQSPNNKKIYNIEFLMNSKIVIEPPYHKREIVQCKNCQRYGHTKQYCCRIPRCVKCTGDHHTSQCNRKDKCKEVKCVNCEGNHPANYKGCTIRKEIQKRKFPPLRPKTNQEAKEAPTQATASNLPSNPVEKERSYAQAVKANTQKEQQNLDEFQKNQPVLTHLITKMEQMMTVIMESMSNMTKMITLLMSKLT